MKKYYMHTMQGKPAFFDHKTGCIFFAGYGARARGLNVLVPTLQQIYKERRISEKNDPMPAVDWDYGHVLVYANE